MGAHLKLKFAAAGAALLVVTLCAAAAQTRRQPSRRVTNPAAERATPTPEEPRVVSTAEEPQDDPGAARRSRAARRATPQPQKDDEARKALDDLSTEMTRLNKKVDDMERQRKVDLIMERLTRAEQRAEAVQAQLRETLEKEANLQARIEQIDDAMRPENLNRQVALVGTFRPDEERDRLRRQYENEKSRVQSLLDVNAKQRQRLEASLASADLLVERLRSQLDEETRRELEAGAAAAEEGRRPAPDTSPSPRPTATPPPPSF